MALINPKIFGHKIGNKLQDAASKVEVLKNLNIPLPDLDVIRGAVDEEGASREDFINFSRLTQPIFKTLDRYYSDIKSYDPLLSDRASISSILFGNLKINGILDGSAVRYRYVDEKKLSVASGSVNDTTDEITITGHGTNTGDNLRYVEGDTSIGGLVNNTKYFVIKVDGDDNTIKLAATASDATAGNEITLTSQGTGTHTFVTQSKVKIADISTSRVSAWSSSDKRASDSTITLSEQAKARISYGAQVKIIQNTTKARLDFGPQSDANGVSGKPRLQTSQIATQKEFAAEIPTHKIKINLDGQDFELYAMKGIPLIFEGEFEELAPIIDVDPIPGIKPSWKIINVDNPQIFYSFPDVLRNRRSSLSFNVSNEKARYIQFYYSPDNIERIFLRRGKISTLPTAKLNNLYELNLETNTIATLPDLTVFSPKLRTLNMKNNPLNNSEFPEEQKLNSTVLGKLPNTITSLTFGSTFEGSINDGTVATASLIFNQFQSLQRLDLTRYGGKQRFNKDTVDPQCHIPNIPNTCTYYRITRNAFRGIAGGESISQSYNQTSIAGDGNAGFDSGKVYLDAPEEGSNEKTIKTAENLEELIIDRNYDLTDESFGAPGAFKSDKLKKMVMTFTNLPLPDLRNKQNLETFEANHTRNAGHLAYVSGGSPIYKFDNCTKLKSLIINHSKNGKSRSSYPNGGLHGPFPQKFTHPNLEILKFQDTRFQGGMVGVNGGDTIPNGIFVDCQKLKDFRVNSHYLNGEGENGCTGKIGETVFSFTPNLEFLEIISHNNLIGNLPNVGACPKLKSFVLKKNSFDGTISAFTSNSSLQLVDVSFNNLSGSIPGYSGLPSLIRLKLFNNKFTKINQFSLPKLIECRAHVNEMTGTIPSFVNCPNLKFLTLYSNRFDGYTPGAIAQNYKIRLIDFSDNRLSQVDLNNIINDLHTNYETSGSNRSLRLNIKNQAGQVIPSGDAIEQINKMVEAGWTIDTDLPPS